MHNMHNTQTCTHNMHTTLSALPHSVLSIRSVAAQCHTVELHNCPCCLSACRTQLKEELVRLRANLTEKSTEQEQKLEWYMRYSKTLSTLLGACVGAMARQQRRHA
jgi:hypothetical protein